VVGAGDDLSGLITMDKNGTRDGASGSGVGGSDDRKKKVSADLKEVSTQSTADVCTSLTILVSYVCY
jgi:hypothetical protein